jgi:hypothetical protein
MSFQIVRTTNQQDSKSFEHSWTKDKVFDLIYPAWGVILKNQAAFCTHLPFKWVDRARGKILEPKADKGQPTPVHWVCLLS